MYEMDHDVLGGEGISAEMLMQMSRPELEELYGEAGVPESLEELDGEPRGLVLAVAGLDGEPWAGLLRRVGGSAHLPWEGKSFRSESAQQGEGANRFRFLGELAPFSTGIGPSAIDGKPCIQLDYDRPDNPWPIRRIRDELREVAPGLFFGPAMLDLGGRQMVVLYFAVDFRHA